MVRKIYSIYSDLENCKLITITQQYYPTVIGRGINATGDASPAIFSQLGTECLISPKICHSCFHYCS